MPDCSIGSRPSRATLPYPRAVFPGLAALFLAAVLAAGAVPRLIVRGDQAAWAEAQAALIKLQRLVTYRVRTTTLGRPTTIDVVNPDRFRIRIVGTATIETVIVGKDTRARVSGGDWRCLSLPSVLPDMNPEKWIGDVTASKGSLAVLEGVRVQSYNYTLRVGGPTGHYRLYVTISTGLPKRLLILEVKEDEPESVKSQFDYYDFNAPVTIELPSCR
ncbi:MAG: hypothetical protein ACRDFT_03645 [bacterium]